jgi:hypothetical protein
MRKLDDAQLRKFVNPITLGSINENIKRQRACYNQRTFRNWEPMAYGCARITGVPFNDCKEQTNKLVDKKINCGENSAETK